MSIQVGAAFLEKPHEGKGILLGGVAGVPPAHVVIVGGGTVGTNALNIAVGMGARVTVIDRSLDRLRYLDDVFHNQIETLASNRFNIAAAVKRRTADRGSVDSSRQGAKVVSEEMVASMRPGSVIVDVAIDQGGCVRPSITGPPTTTRFISSMAWCTMQ